MKIRSLSHAVDYYLSSQRQFGFKMTSETRVLNELVQYAKSHHFRGFTTKLVLQWAQAPTDASPVWWIFRLNAARRLARFWRAFNPMIPMPPKGVFGSGPKRRAVHIYSSDQINQLMNALDELCTPSKAACLKTLFGLLYCTGLRISEALALKTFHVDWDQKSIQICHSKSKSWRQLPLHVSTMEALCSYHRKAKKYRQCEVFFVRENGLPLCYSEVHSWFIKCRKHLQWGFSPAPRIHDLRHTFAVNTLSHWYESAQNVGSKILALCTYLGHRNIRHTYWYLTGTPELLAIASGKLTRFVKEASHE